MTGKLHSSLGIYIGISGGIFMAFSSNEINSFAAGSAFGIGCLLGSLFPDIDSPTSKISKHIPFIPKIINKIFGHRGFIHSPMLYILLGLLFNTLQTNGWQKYFLNGFLIGCTAHLIQDILTIGGIPLLYPFDKRKINLGFFKSGSKIDSVLTTGIAIIWTCGLFMFKTPMTV